MFIIFLIIASILIITRNGFITRSPDARWVVVGTSCSEGVDKQSLSLAG